MNKIPTAEQWIRDEMNIIDVQEAAKKLIEFTNLHVTKALEESKEYYEVNYDIYPIDEVEPFDYPLKNIK